MHFKCSSRKALFKKQTILPQLETRLTIMRQSEWRKPWQNQNYHDRVQWPCDVVAFEMAAS